MNMSDNGTKPDDDMDFDAMLESSFTPGTSVSPGDKIEATVVSVQNDYVFLDLGTRDDGILMRAEVLDEDGNISVSEGQTITVFVTGFKDGATVCGLRIGSGMPSDKPDGKNEAVAALQDAYDSGMPVEGTVKESIKGGFTVTVLGQRAFCPISQIDNKYCETPDEHVGRSYDFQITKVEQDGRNIVVSRRKLLELQSRASADKMWGEMKEGDTYEGTVSSLRPFGAFVDIGGIDGLLHVSEISYDRVNDPAEILQVGQKLKVAIKELDPEKQRISLSLKALLDDPWSNIATQLNVNGVYQGRVSRLAQFGAFVELLPGIDGLVHISQMSDKHINNPREIVAQGDTVTVRIVEIDPERKRISLTMKAEDEKEDWAAELSQSDQAHTAGKSMGTLGDLLAGKLKK